MRYTAAEKYESIRLVEEANLPAKQVLDQLGIPRSTFYRWVRQYTTLGIDGLKDHTRGPGRIWNKLPQEVCDHVVEVALEKLEMTPRELAWHITDTERYYISESSVYRILKRYDLITSPAYIVVSASDKFKQPTHRVHEMWQTDFTYLRITHWGWYYLSTILDDYSRYIIAWKLFPTMRAEDVIETLDMARAATGIAHVKLRHRTRLLSDNGSCYIAGDLAEYLEEQDMIHVRGRPRHPMTQGKIERYHRTMKNQILLHHYYQPAVLERALGRFVDYYNNERYHESLGNLRPVDVYEGRGWEIQTEREEIKRETMKRRRKENLRQMTDAMSRDAELTTPKPSLRLESHVCQSF